MDDPDLAWSSDVEDPPQTELGRALRTVGVILIGALVEHVVFAAGRARGIW